MRDDFDRNSFTDKLSEKFQIFIIADVFFFLPENNKLSGNAGNSVAAAFLIVFGFYVRSSVRSNLPGSSAESIFLHESFSALARIECDGRVP